MDTGIIMRLPIYPLSHRIARTSFGWGAGTRLKQKSMNEDVRTIEDLELAEIAEQEMEIIMNSIPDGRSFEILNEVIRRFRDKLTD